ncbi:hypothetical protein BGZ98_006166, partial [Dissophora globulifera]
DLKQYRDRLQELETFIRVDEAKASIPDIQTRILRRKLDFNNNLLKELQDAAESISPELAPTHRRLVQLKIALGTIASKTVWDACDVHQIQEELREIEAKRIDGKFMDAQGHIVSGQAAVVGLLEDCYDDCHNLLATKERVPPELQGVFVRLQTIKADLERLVLTQRWTLRETDLWQYEMQLSEIGALRKNGKFVDRDGDVQEGQ